VIGWDDVEGRGHKERSKLNAEIKDVVSNFRSALDRLTEVEMGILMSTGYTLATAGLKLSQANNVQDNEDSDDPFLTSTGISSLQRSVSSSRHKFQDRVGKLSPSEKQMMFPKHWGYFDVDAPTSNDWPFTPFQRMLAHPAVERKNPAIDELRDQLRHCVQPFGVQRWWNSNILISVLFAVVALTAFIYACYVMISDFIDSGGVDEFGCRCYTQSALFYVTLFFFAVIMLAKPGYLGRAVWCIFMLPVFGGFHTWLIDPWLAYRGSQERMLRIFNATLPPEERIFAYTARYVRLGLPKVLSPFDVSGNNVAPIAPVPEEMDILRDPVPKLSNAEGIPASNPTSVDSSTKLLK